MIEVNDIDDSEWSDGERAEFYRRRWNKVSAALIDARSTIKAQRWMMGILAVALILALTLIRS